MATTTILGVFDDSVNARRALDELRASTLELVDTSIITRSADAGNDRLTAGEGAVVGAVWGGLVGLIALIIPGVGPFIAGGAIFAALTGAAAGAVVGGVAGALIENTGIPREEAERYEAAVHQGKTLVAVKAREEDALAVRRILAHDGARSIHENETDIIGGGTVSVAMYDETGRTIDQVATPTVRDVQRGQLVEPVDTHGREGNLVSTIDEYETGEVRSSAEVTMPQPGRVTSYADAEREGREQQGRSADVAPPRDIDLGSQDSTSGTQR
jgi:uncharacterized membrane protein